MRECLCLLALLGGVAVVSAQESLTLARKGTAELPIIHSAQASARVQQAAQTLAKYLGQIGQAKFDVKAYDAGARPVGIYVGTPGHFPALKIKPHWHANEPTDQEDYLLQSKANALCLIGASDLAVEHAVWDLLYRLGYRQFFPGPHWEVVPKQDPLQIRVDAKEHPSYYSRRIWYGFGAARWSAEHYRGWCAKNRCVPGIALSTGHAYPGYYARNKAEFDKHPEYLSLVNGERRFRQFCISNPGLRHLIVEDAIRQFDAKPNMQSISVDPNDGGGWCECAECKKMGNVSNRAVTLANQVAEAVNRKHPGKFVGMYAYSSHSPPPTIDVHPRVVISVATSFIQGGFTVDQLMDGWQKKKATLGIREYYSVHTWDRDLPGRAHGANTTYLQRTIPHFHAHGARFLSAESSDNWGCNGLGYYLASRLMWDVKEAERTNELIDDFLDKSFGPAKKPMADYFKLTDAASRPLLTDDLVGRMYRHLAAARRQTNDPAILARIDDMVLYTRYVDQWLDFTATAKVADHQASFESLLKYVYRMKDRLLLHTVAFARDVPGRDKSLTVPAEARFNVPEGRNPWMSSKPYTNDEIVAILTKGMETRKPFEFQPIAFSNNLVPARLPDADGAKAIVPNLYIRGTRSFHTWVEKAPATIKLKVSGGHIYGNKGPAVVNFFPALELEGKSVCEAKIAPDRAAHVIELTTTFTGLHRIEVADKNAGTKLDWPNEFPLNVLSTHEDPIHFQGRWSLYFYVPKGIKLIGGYSAGAGTMLDGNGKKAHDFAAKPANFSVRVPEGQDGRFWRMNQCVGDRQLMTIPSVFTRHPGELLLPAELVRKGK